MGRYPFVAYAQRYVEENKAYFAETTMTECDRKLRYLGRIFMTLRQQNRTDTDNPTKMGEKEIREFLWWMRKEANEGQGLDPLTQESYLKNLGRLLIWCGNPILEQMKQRNLIPYGHIKKEIRQLSEQDVWQIVKAAHNISGWRGQIARFLMVLYPYTGLRPSELRRQSIKHVDRRSWTITVTHPKGEGKYGTKRTIPIAPQARPHLMSFLEARRRYLLENGVKEADCDLLIPRIEDGKVLLYSSNAFEKLKRDVEALAGVKFRLKDFRPTFAQMLKDRDVPIEAVSKLMGHCTTLTTERYYARIKDTAAFDLVNKAWGNAQESPILGHEKKSAIEPKGSLPGYA